jgi:polysaccharide pyruvyl transferase WcaK-like protein
MKRVLVINEYYSDNIGDQAINIGLKNVLDLSGFSVDNQGFSQSSEDYSSLDYKNSARLKKFKEKTSNYIILKSIFWILKNAKRILISAYKCEGFAIIGGGQLVLNKSSFAVAMFAWVTSLKLFNKKVFLVSIKEKKTT